jgi:hypothetical protein
MMKIRSCLRLVGPAQFCSVLLAALSAHAQDLNVYRGTQVPPQVERIYEQGLQFLAAAQNDEGTIPGNYGSEPATAA